MIYLSIYLYLMGATLMWWWARSHKDKNLAAKVLSAILWPILVPVVALWY